MSHALPSDAPRDGQVSDMLGAGERVLWQGRPDVRSWVSWPILVSVVQGLILMGFGALWLLSTLPWSEMITPTGFNIFGYALELLAEAPGFFVLLMFLLIIGLLPVMFGAWRLRAGVRADFRDRARSWYALTTRRAFIAKEGDRPAIRRWELSADKPLRHIKLGRLSSVYFYKYSVRQTRQGATGFGEKSYIDVKRRGGFRMIADGRAVADHIRQIKAARP